MIEPDEGETAAVARRRVVFIVGSGRSGTSALACTLQTLGMHVPQPEVVADESNPKGFGESQWVVDFHDRMLRRANVRVADARPQAWFDTGKLSTVERLREEVGTWLREQFTDDVHEIVVKDPRLAWFIGLWHAATLRNEVDAVYAVMLRPPAEVLGSKQRYYSSHVGEVSRAASWVNHMLHTERATRGFERSFIRYHDLLDDWTVPIYGFGERFDLQAITAATAKDIRRVYDFIDPSLYRVRTTWEEVDVPAPLSVLIEETWRHLDRMADGDGDCAETHAALDQIRLDYTRLYEDAEAIAQSTALAARRKRPVAIPVEPATATVEPAVETPTPAQPAPGRRGLRGLRRQTGT